MLITNYDNKKIADYLRNEQPRKVCLIFWHGLGDLIMFMPLYDRLREMFPDIKIDIALQRDVGQEDLLPDAILIQSPNRSLDEYDYTFQVHFPMAEHLDGLWTKAEWCCKQELGIDPISSYPRFDYYEKSLVALNFHATALPGPINPSEDVAKQIWSEVIAAGLIPIETFFKHTYFNPANKKFEFIDRHIRAIAPSIPKLIGLLKGCRASICVASGTLPLSLAIMPEATLYLQKTYPVQAYTRQVIASIDVNNYQKGSVEKWLMSI